MVDGGTLPDPNPQSPNPLDLDVFQVPRGQTTTSAVWSGLIHFCPIFNERILDVFHYRTLMTECYKQLLCKKMPCSHFYDHAIFTCTIFSAKMWDVLFATKKQPHWNDLEEKKRLQVFPVHMVQFTIKKPSHPSGETFCTTCAGIVFCCGFGDLQVSNFDLHEGRVYLNFTGSSDSHNSPKELRICFGEYRWLWDIPVAT